MWPYLTHIGRVHSFPDPLEFSPPLWNPKISFVTVNKRAIQVTPSRVRRFQYTSSNPLFLTTHLISATRTEARLLRAVPYLQVLSLKYCKHFLSPPYVLHALQLFPSYVSNIAKQSTFWIPGLWKMGLSKHRQEITTIRCIIAQKSADIARFVAVPWNHAIN